MEVGDWLQKNMQTLISTPIAWLGLVIGALLLPPSRTRRTINTTITITIILELSFIAWVAYRQTEVAGPTPLPRPTPTVQKWLSARPKPYFSSALPDSFAQSSGAQIKRDCGAVRVRRKVS
jgi:hypothetical protein